jgi:hypothetical protein
LQNYHISGKFYLVPPRVKQRRPPKPKHRVAVEAVFFPGEAAKILGLKGVNYRQLRRLFDLVASGQPASRPGRSLGARRRAWARFTFRDLLGVRMAVELAGGREVLVGSRGRLLIRPVEQAVAAIRSVGGLRYPLLQATWGRVGSAIVAEVDGLVMEPRTRQLMIAEVVEAVAAHATATDSPLTARTVCRQVRDQYRELRLDRASG